MKPEIPLNLLCEWATSIIIFIKDDESNNYERVEEIVLREFEQTHQVCLESFKKV